MRQPEYLSPSSIQTWRRDRDEFYLRYLAEERPPKIPQTEPMSVGASFDAHIKSHLHYKLHGNYGNGDRFRFENLFEAQVEPQNRSFARQAGEYIFKVYVASGALADLMLELEQASAAPRFEITVEGRISHQDYIGTVKLLGKPDCYFITGDGTLVILDWKVNGYCGKSNTSPKPGYVTVRDGWSPPTSNNHRLAHKGATLLEVGGVTVNIAQWLEDIDKSWADQLAIYGWVLGQPVGGNFIAGLDQIVSTGKMIGNYPMLRVASHRGRISGPYQTDLFQFIHFIWSSILQDHIFDTLSIDESRERSRQLDEYHKAFSDKTPEERWYAASVREHSNY